MIWPTDCWYWMRPLCQLSQNRLHNIHTCFVFKWANPLFGYFCAFQTQILKKNCRLQRDSNLDCERKRLARWPLDHHHHGPKLSHLFLSGFWGCWWASPFEVDRPWASTWPSQFGSFWPALSSHPMTSQRWENGLFHRDQSYSLCSVFLRSFQR